MNIKSILYDAFAKTTSHKAGGIFKSDIIDEKTVQKNKYPEAMLDELSNGRGDD